MLSLRTAALVLAAVAIVWHFNDLQAYRASLKRAMGAEPDTQDTEGQQDSLAQNQQGSLHKPAGCSSTEGQVLELFRKLQQQQCKKLRQPSCKKKKECEADEWKTVSCPCNEWKTVIEQATIAHDLITSDTELGYLDEYIPPRLRRLPALSIGHSKTKFNVELFCSRLEELPKEAAIEKRIKKAPPIDLEASHTIDDVLAQWDYILTESQMFKKRKRQFKVSHLMSLLLGQEDWDEPLDSEGNTAEEELKDALKTFVSKLKDVRLTQTLTVGRWKQIKADFPKAQDLLRDEAITHFDKKIEDFLGERSRHTAGKVSQEDVEDMYGLDHCLRKVSVVDENDISLAEFLEMSSYDDLS